MSALSLSPNRRNFLAFSAAAGAAGVLSSKLQAETEDGAIRPFRIDVPEEELVNLRQRIAATKWPERETVSDATQGVQLATMRELARYWATDYDWRKVEVRLNGFANRHSQPDRSYRDRPGSGPNPPVGSCGSRSGREDSDAFLDGAVTLSQARDHSGRKRCEDLCPPDARQRARDPDLSPSRRASLAGRTSLRSPSDFRVNRFARGQERAFDQDDLVARFPRSGDRQGGSRRTPAARLWSQASRRPADSVAGSVAHARTPGASAGVTNLPQTGTLETEICGQRLSTARAANGARRRPKRLSRPTDAAASRGNVVLFCGVGNHSGSRGLPGGGRSPAKPVSADQIPC
jgi:hypothetical protein